MSKFKVGDEVIVVYGSFDNVHEIGWRGKVHGSNMSSLGQIIVEIDKKYLADMHPNENYFGYKESDIELIEVYNSPLFQALK